MIVCRTLGPLEVELNGGFPPAELLWRKHLALLVYLARSRPRGRSREHLMGLLWAEKPEAAARHSLNEAVRVLRRCLGEEAVDTSARQVRLAADVVRLDLDELEAHAAAAEWCRAAATVAGEFLEGFSVPDASGLEEWLAAERGFWRRRGVEILVRCAEARLAEGDGDAAVAMAQRACALDPRSDLAMRAGLRSSALVGERARALERYEAFARRLSEELGIAPEPETSRLAELVRREKSIAPASRAGTSEPTVRTQGPPLVDRERELARLLEAVTACRTGRRATAIVLEAEAGIGKTRLLEEVLARLRLEGVAVSAVRAVEADRAEPWSGLRALARGGLLDARGVAAAPGGALAAFAREIPEVQERFPGSVREPPLPLARAFGQLTRSALEEQPVFLAVDDAEWLDRESVLALGAALRDLSGLPFGVLVTTSPRVPAPELDDLRARVGRDLAGAVVVLQPFGVAALRVLARHFLPTFTELEIDRVTRRVGTDSAGVPVLAVELLRAVALGMDLGSTSGAWPEPLKTLDQTLPGELPDAVVSAIRIDYRRLSRAAQQVLAAASILDDRCAPELLARAVDLPVAEVTPALDELEWHRWLVSEPRGYGFVARIVRQVIARDMLTPGQRRRILERVGRPAE